MGRHEERLGTSSKVKEILDKGEAKSSSSWEERVLDNKDLKFEIPDEITEPNNSLELLKTNSSVALQPLAHNKLNDIPQSEKPNKVVGLLKAESEGKKLSEDGLSKPKVLNINDLVTKPARVIFDKETESFFEELQRDVEANEAFEELQPDVEFGEGDGMEMDFD